MTTLEYAVTSVFGMFGLYILFVFAAYIYCEIRDWYRKNKSGKEDKSNHGAGRFA